jgi:hypothetical protein
MSHNTGNGNGPARGGDTPRTPDTFPPVLGNLSAMVDEASGNVLFTGRGELAILPTELTVPISYIEVVYSTILNMRVQRMQAAAAAAQLEKLSAARQLVGVQ